MKKLLLAALSFLMTSVPAVALVWYDGSNAVSYQVNGKTSPVVGVALDMFRSDMAQVTGKPAVASKKGVIQVFQLDKNPNMVAKLQKSGCPAADVQGKMDSFWIGIRGGQIHVLGNNGRGCAYGLLELSRMAGVSPWVWWGDVVPEKRSRLTLDDGFTTMQSPSVAYRGIFINDEDWSLREWSSKTFEPIGVKGSIGPRTYKEIFKLLLRLRANMIWPAMHEGTTGFFTVKGNQAVADSCGILIGTSHCEPLLRNNVAEWDVKQRGAYNYITNGESVRQYWTERLKEVAGTEDFFTIGMRGIHDGSMEGVKTPEEKLTGLQQVIDDQRVLLAKYINKDVTKIPQVFIPYKEVLEIMESGLRVPDDVTLMWCDDNYGYMTRLSDADQQRRSGGGGVYYHLSYWGRPHDYLWLTTTQPGLIYSEMRAAYDHNARKLWIANCHDPKVAAYDLEFFLDMAWNINAIKPNTICQHLEHWLCTQFGMKAGKQLAPVMESFYNLCSMRRPEFMGWNQVELDKKKYARGWSPVSDTEFSPTEFGGELDRYVNRYAELCQKVKEVSMDIRPELQDAYFAAVSYPVCAAAAMAEKQLLAQVSRNTEDTASKSAANRSMSAYQEIQRLTAYYNNELSGGKWKGLMSMEPRGLYVFGEPTLPMPANGDLMLDYHRYERPTDVPDGDDFVARNASSYTSASCSLVPIQLLGHSMQAVPLPKGETVTYHFEAKQEGDAVLYTAMIPTQPNDKGDLRYAVSIDGAKPTVISLKEKYRSEFWKLSVLRGQALKRTNVRLSKGAHTLTIQALDDHIILDQWMVDFKPSRKFYLIPSRK